MAIDLTKLRNKVKGLGLDLEKCEETFREIHGEMLGMPGVVSQKFAPALEGYSNTLSALVDGVQRSWKLLGDVPVKETDDDFSQNSRFRNEDDENDYRFNEMPEVDLEPDLTSGPKSEIMSENYGLDDYIKKPLYENKHRKNFQEIVNKTTLTQTTRNDKEDMRHFMSGLERNMFNESDRISSREIERMERLDKMDESKLAEKFKGFENGESTPEDFKKLCNFIHGENINNIDFSDFM